MMTYMYKYIYIIPQGYQEISKGFSTGLQWGNWGNNKVSIRFQKEHTQKFPIKS